MIKKIALAGTVAATVIAGGAIGASLIGSASAATSPAPAAGSGSTSATTPNAPWHSRTDPAHEASESPARQAAEKTADATGVRPPGDGGPGGHSNVEPAHEAGETAAHAAEEKARDAQVGAAPTGTATG